MTLMGSRNIQLPNNMQYQGLELRILDERIDSGSFCSIDKAEILETGELVAIKYSTIPLSDDVSNRLGDVSYIPRTLYREECAPYLIVEEWVEGTTLFDLAGDDGVCDTLFPLIASDLLKVLCSMFYNSRIYHGDLTPNNILWCRETGKNRLVLLDFDPWYQVGENGFVVASDISGTIPFLPPEYLFGNLSFDGEKAITYCAGAILYHIRYGYPPYCKGLGKDTINRMIFGLSSDTEEESDEIQRRDFRNWKEHLKHLDSSALIAGEDFYSKTLARMLSLNPGLRPSLRAVTSLLVESSKN